MKCQIRVSSLLLFIIYSLTGLSGVVYGQIFNDMILDRRIRSVQLYREGWNLSYPLLKLFSGDNLVLHFDLLDDNPESYYYTFVHCDKNWNESSVFPSDYLEGIPENLVENYYPSFNTKISYYHYKISFPNDRIKFKISGNYVIKIFLAGQPDNPVLSKRFMIFEDIALINAGIQRPQMTQFYNTGQQIDFSVSYPSIRVTDPRREISASVLQNGQWAYAKTNLEPDFIAPNEVRYTSMSEKNIFPGRAEYRYFDIKSVRYQSEYIRAIDFVQSVYHVYLMPSENREGKPYFYWQDFNGKYYIAIQEGRDMDRDADYVWVYFTLPSRYEITGGKMYVFGALSNWEFSDENVMTYDREKAQYQAGMLLKQGWYNYEYLFLRNGQKTAFPSYFESNHFETENDYMILVYYRNTMARFDRLIGARIISTVK